MEIEIGPNLREALEAFLYFGGAFLVCYYWYKALR
jgi:hypothetical protein